jgi:hypothetical protein
MPIQVRIIRRMPSVLDRLAAFDACGGPLLCGGTFRGTPVQDPVCLHVYLYVSLCRGLSRADEAWKALACGDAAGA